MPDNDQPDLKFWLGFNLVSGIGPAKVQALLDYYGNLENAWRGHELEWQRVGLDQRSIQSLLESRGRLDLDRELAGVRQAGVTLLTWQAPAYPRRLREIPNPPPLLFVRGKVADLDRWAIALVGTRRLTAYGRQVTRDLAAGLVASEIAVISGMARGIDAVAHKTAVELGGATLAVLGSGLDTIYPPENRPLARDILASGRGAIVSEYALGVQPEARNFPPRNRIISGLALGVIVVEAGERSGALITAAFAMEQNREVFAVPGNVNSPASAGTNRLIQQGAKLVRRIDDVLEELNLALAPEQQAVQLSLPESTEEAVLLAHLSQQPTHIDELTQRAQLPTAVVSSTLTLMELKGMVQHVGGMQYALLREPGPEYET